MQVTHSNQYSQTTTKIHWESRLSSNKQPAHKQGACRLYVWGSEVEWDAEKARAWVKVELNGKQGHHIHHLSLKSTESSGATEGSITTFYGKLRKAACLWLPCGKPSSLRTLSYYPGDSEWRGNESQLTRPLSVKERHHQEGLPIHEAPHVYRPFIVACNYNTHC